MSIELKQNGEYLNLVLQKPKEFVMSQPGDNFECTLKFSEPMTGMGKSYKNQDGSMSAPKEWQMYNVTLHTLNGKSVEKDCSFFADGFVAGAKGTVGDHLKQYGVGDRLKLTFEPKAGKKAPLRMWRIEKVTEVKPVSSPAQDPKITAIVDKIIELAQGKKQDYATVATSLAAFGIADKPFVDEIFAAYTKRLA